MKKIVLSNRSDYKQVIQEEQYLFHRSILELMGFPIEEYLPEELNDFTVKHKIGLKKALKQSNIYIIGEGEESSIYVDRDIVAHWKKPFVQLKENPAELDPRERIYAEIHLEFASVLIEEEDNE